MEMALNQQSAPVLVLYLLLRIAFVCDLRTRSNA